MNSEIDYKSIVYQMNILVEHQTDRGFADYLSTEQEIRVKFHPYTCGNNSNHTPLYPYFDGEKVRLICRDCDYTQ